MRDILHSVRQSVSVRRVSKAFVVTAMCILLVGSMALVAPVAAQENNETIPQCDQGPPIPGQGEGGVSSVEVALVNDRSGSMDEGSRMQDLKDASTGFVNRLESDDESAAISFAESSTVDKALGSDHAATITAIESLPDPPEQGGTDMSEAIETGHTELTESENATANSAKAMLFMTDGGVNENFDTEQDIIDAANAAKDDGVTIFVIGLGDVVDEDVMSDVATGDNLYLAPDSGDLDSIYEDITEAVEEIQASQLTIDTRQLFQPGETHPYTVTNETVHPDGSVTTEDVTSEASVNTSNSSLLEADEADAELSATNDANASAGVVVTATHGGETGCVNAIVAEASMENLEILPPVWRYGTFLGDWTVFFFILSIGAGIVGTRIATSFMGLSMMELVLIMGWFGGYISTGLVLTSVFACLFIGLNLAANIDYQVTR